jgi:hypothetical protein
MKATRVAGDAFGTRPASVIGRKELFGNPFSPTILQASLQTDAAQARNRTTGVIMPLIKKKDLKSYFASRRRNANHSKSPTDRPNAIISSGLKAEFADPNRDHVAKEQPKQPFSNGPDIP